MLRKGNINDMLGIGIAFASLTAVFLFCRVIWSRLSPVLNETMMDNGVNQTLTNTIIMNGDRTTGLLLNLIPVVIIILGLASLYLAYLIPTNPIFLPVSIVVGIINIFMSALLTELMWALVNHPEIISISNQYEFLVGFIRYYTWIASALFGLLLIVIYARSRDDIIV